MTTDAFDSSALFDAVAQDIADRGYSVQTAAVPTRLARMLLEQSRSASSYRKAGTGRDNGHSVDVLIRTDEICWIDDTTPAGDAWIAWMTSLQACLNARLFLGLFSFESHFSRYGKGDFYATHRDAFSGAGNRILSIVVYLNEGWLTADAGELVLHTGDTPAADITVVPELCTMVVFLSRDFPHQVLATNRERLSIAGWFRTNGTHGGRLDPPR